MANQNEPLFILQTDSGSLGAASVRGKATIASANQAVKSTGMLATLMKLSSQNPDGIVLTQSEGGVIKISLPGEGRAIQGDLNSEDKGDKKIPSDGSNEYYADTPILNKGFAPIQLVTVGDGSVARLATQVFVLGKLAVEKSRSQSQSPQSQSPQDQQQQDQQQNDESVQMKAQAASTKKSGQKKSYWHEAKFDADDDYNY